MKRIITLLLILISFTAGAQSYTFSKADCRLEIYRGAQLRYSMTLADVTWADRFGGISIEVKDGVSSLYCRANQIANYTGDQIDSLKLDLSTWQVPCQTTSEDIFWEGLAAGISPKGDSAIFISESTDAVTTKMYGTADAFGFGIKGVFMETEWAGQLDTIATRVDFKDFSPLFGNFSPTLSLLAGRNQPTSNKFASMTLRHNGVTTESNATIEAFSGGIGVNPTIKTHAKNSTTGATGILVRNLVEATSPGTGVVRMEGTAYGLLANILNETIDLGAGVAVRSIDGTFLTGFQSRWDAFHMINISAGDTVTNDIDVPDAALVGGEIMQYDISETRYKHVPSIIAFTPTSESDATYAIGQVAYDATYLYIKVTVSPHLWERIAWGAGGW